MSAYFWVSKISREPVIWGGNLTLMQSQFLGYSRFFLKKRVFEKVSDEFINLPFFT